MDNRLVLAIKEKRLIELSYKNHLRRVVEPHDYGIQQRIERLLCYQVGGYSSSRKPRGWRMFDYSNIHGLIVLERRFPGSRSDAAQHHRKWDVLFARVE